MSKQTKEPVEQLAEELLNKASWEVEYDEGHLLVSEKVALRAIIAGYQLGEKSVTEGEELSSELPANSIKEPVIDVSFKDHDKVVLTNPNGDTYTSKSEELIDFLHGCGRKINLSQVPVMSEQKQSNSITGKEDLDNYYPGSSYQRLFNAISDTKGIATQGEMDEIVRIVKEDFVNEAD